MEAQTRWWPLRLTPWKFLSEIQGQVSRLQRSVLEEEGQEHCRPKKYSVYEPSLPTAYWKDSQRRANAADISARPDPPAIRTGRTALDHIRPLAEEKIAEC